MGFASGFRSLLSGSMFAAEDEKVVKKVERNSVINDSSWLLLYVWNQLSQARSIIS